MTPVKDLVPDGVAEPVGHSGGESLGGDPSPGRCHQVRLGAGPFHYRVWTTEQPSPVSVVLLHGVAGSVASWSRVGPALAAAGTPAFALDLRGHGGSIRPPPGSYGLAAAAGDVADFLTALHLRAPVLVGHCWGADIALALATAKHATTVRPRTWPVSSSRNRWPACSPLTPDIAASVVHDGAAAGPLLPLLARLTIPTLLLRADPRCGGMLTDTHWGLINRLLPTHSTAHHLPDTPHDIHRGNHPTFMRHLQNFLHTITTGPRGG
jgi:pimeloyl-ACP methyl ester carboxylesterase